MAKPQFRIVEDRHEDVVEFMGCGTCQLTQGGHFLSLPQLLVEAIDLLFEGDLVLLHDYLVGPASHPLGSQTAQTAKLLQAKGFAKADILNPLYLGTLPLFFYRRIELADSNRTR